MFHLAVVGFLGYIAFCFFSARRAAKRAAKLEAQLYARGQQMLHPDISKYVTTVPIAAVPMSKAEKRGFAAFCTVIVCIVVVSLMTAISLANNQANNPVTMHAWGYLGR
jgi:hypothetical protein